MDGAVELENATKKDVEERAVHDADRHSIEGGGYSSTSYFGSPSSGTSTPMRAVNTLIEGCVGQSLELPLGLELGLGDILEKTTDVVQTLPPHETQAIEVLDSPSPNRPLKENTTLINGVGEVLECSETDENSTSIMQSVPPQGDVSTSEVEIAAEEKQASPKAKKEFPHNWSLLEACGITPIPPHERLPITLEAPQMPAPPSNASQRDSFAQTSTAVPIPETRFPESKTSEPEVETTSASPTVLSVNLEKEAVLMPKEKQNVMDIAGINLMDKFGSMVGELEQFARFVQDAKAIADQMETSGLFDSIRRLVDSHGAMIKEKVPGEIKQERVGADSGVEKLQEGRPGKDGQSATREQPMLPRNNEKQPMPDSSITDCVKSPGGGAMLVGTDPKHVLMPVTTSGEDSGWDIPDLLTGSGIEVSKNIEISAPLSLPPLVAPIVCGREESAPEKHTLSLATLASMGLGTSQKSPTNSLGKSDVTDVVPSSVVDQKNNPPEITSKPDPPHPPGLNPSDKRLTVAEALALNPPGRTGTTTNDQQPQKTNVIGGRGPPPNWNGNRGRGFRPPQGRNSYSQGGWGGDRNGFSGNARDGERMGTGRDHNRQSREQSWDNGWDSGSVQQGARSSSQGGREYENNNARNWNDSRSGGDADSNHSNHSSQNQGPGHSQWGGGDGNHGRSSSFSGGMGDGDRRSGWGDRGSQGNRWGGDRAQGRGYSARQTQISNTDGWGSWEPLEE